MNYKVEPLIELSDKVSNITNNQIATLSPFSQIWAKCHIIIPENNEFYNIDHDHINNFIKNKTAINDVIFYSSKFINNDDLIYFKNYIDKDYIIGNEESLKLGDYLISFELFSQSSTPKSTPNHLEALYKIEKKVNDIVKFFQYFNNNFKDNFYPFTDENIESRKSAVNWLKNHNKWDIVNNYLLKMGESVNHNSLVVHLANILYMNEQHDERRELTDNIISQLNWYYDYDYNCYKLNELVLEELRELNYSHPEDIKMNVLSWENHEIIIYKEDSDEPINKKSTIIIYSGKCYNKDDLNRIMDRTIFRI